MVHRALLITWVAAAQVGCGGEPRLYRVVDQVTPSGDFTTRDVELPTLTFPQEVRGEAVEMVGRAQIRTANLVPSDGARSRKSVMLHPQPVSARWVMQGDVAIPRDYDTLNLLSAYAHYEQAVLFFQELGVTCAFEPAPVYYHPSVDDPFGVLPHTDNAAYFANVDGFLLLPMYVLQEIPFSMNPGVLAHEYAHRVFYFEAWGGQMFDTLLRNVTDDAGLQVWNLLRALDEGIADYFGAMLAGDPNFIAHSVFDQISDERALDVSRAVHSYWLSGALPSFNGVYDPYTVGAVVSSTLWGFGQISGEKAVAHAIITAQRQLAIALVESFEYRIGEFEARVIAALPAEDRPALCARALESYQKAWVSFVSVCP